jgi:mannan endo-1,4-beta-mannosidase
MLLNFAPFLLFGSAAAAAALGNKAPKGFVTTNGEVFKLDGKDFYFAGSNAYYFPFSDVTSANQIFCSVLTRFS